MQSRFLRHQQSEAKQLHPKHSPLKELKIGDIYIKHCFKCTIQHALSKMADFLMKAYLGKETPQLSTQWLKSSKSPLSPLCVCKSIKGKETTDTPDEGPQGGPATATETDGVISEPITVLVEAAVAVTSREENDGEDDVPEDKGSESVVEGVKDGDEKEEDVDEEFEPIEAIKEVWFIVDGVPIQNPNPASIDGDDFRGDFRRTIATPFPPLNLVTVCSVTPYLLSGGDFYSRWPTNGVSASGQSDGFFSRRFISPLVELVTVRSELRDLLSFSLILAGDFFSRWRRFISPANER
ncbi:hypothetical protein Bca52824_011508 [Brassica carinata]|uniref:Uncharacterized protein n=1 Tax=Brassica carinata TaxID=52824 RepID=A0A8X8BB78_BRACI|nr:hypothetical protein Bca52824_011508 [Brassica carinata]